MRHAFNPFRFVVIAVAGWMNQKQQHAIDYLREENRVLREQLGGRRLRFTDDQRRRLAAKAKLVGRRVLDEIADLWSAINGRVVNGQEVGECFINDVKNKSRTQRHPGNAKRTGRSGVLHQASTNQQQWSVFAIVCVRLVALAAASRLRRSPSGLAG
jgi:hypothetical protein